MLLFFSVLVVWFVIIIWGYINNNIGQHDCDPNNNNKLATEKRLIGNWYLLTARKQKKDAKIIIMLIVVVKWWLVSGKTINQPEQNETKQQKNLILIEKILNLPIIILFDCLILFMCVGWFIDNVFVCLCFDYHLMIMILISLEIKGNVNPKHKLFFWLIHLFDRGGGGNPAINHSYMDIIIWLLSDFAVYTSKRNGRMTFLPLLLSKFESNRIVMANQSFQTIYTLVWLTIGNIRNI